MPRKNPMSRNFNRTSSATGRMSGGKKSSKTGNYLAGGGTQTLGDGRGGKLTSRRKRYYDVRVGLGLAGG